MPWINFTNYGEELFDAQTETHLQSNDETDGNKIIVEDDKCEDGEKEVANLSTCIYNKDTHSLTLLIYLIPAYWSLAWDTSDHLLVFLQKHNELAMNAYYYTLPLHTLLPMLLASANTSRIKNRKSIWMMSVKPVV